MADVYTEEKVDKSSISLIAKHCYHFMARNIEEYIPTFSHLKAKNIKINQGQNIKPFERSEFRGLCRPTIQFFKAPSEEPINNGKLVKKSDTSSIQVPKRNVKTNKVSNLVFQPNETSDSVKTYVELYKNKRPGIRTKRIVEDAVQAYNATRDEQEAKRNVFRSRTLFKKESVSDSDLNTKHRFEQETSSVYEKQRRTVKVKAGQLPSKEFLERMREFTNSKRIKEETKCINLETEMLNKSVYFPNTEEINRRIVCNEALPLVSLPKLKIRPVNKRKQKTQCPMSIINITLQRDNEPKKEQMKNIFRRSNHSNDGYIQKMKHFSCNKSLSDFDYDDQGANDYEEDLRFLKTKDVLINDAHTHWTTKSPHFMNNVWEQPSSNRYWQQSMTTEKGQQKYDKELFQENTSKQADKHNLMKSFNQVQETCNIIRSIITDSNNREDIRGLNETLENMESLMHSKKVVLNSFKSSPVIDEQYKHSAMKCIKNKFPVQRNSILPNKFKFMANSSEDSIINDKNNQCLKNGITNYDLSHSEERGTNITSSDEYYAVKEIKSRPLFRSSDEYLSQRTRLNLNSSKFSLARLPKGLRNSNYQPFWKTSV